MSTSTPRERGFDVLEKLEEFSEDEVASLAQVFGNRRISLRSMDRLLRVATGGLIACVLLGVAMLLLRDLPGRNVYLGSVNGGITQIGTPVFVVVLVLISVGFGYVFSAATLMNTWFGVTTVGVLLVLIGFYTGALGGVLNLVNLLGFPWWVLWATRAVLLAILLLAVVFRILNKRSQVGRRRVRATLLIAYAVLVGSYLSVIWLTSPTSGGLNLYGLTISMILSSFSFLIYPILQVTAVDFGEWGQFGARRLSTALTSRRHSRPWAFAVLSSLGICVLGYFQLRAGRYGWATVVVRGLGGVGVLTLLILATVGLIELAGLHRLGMRQFNSATLFGVCALTAVLFPPLALYASGGLSHLSLPAMVTPGGRFAPGADVLSETVYGPKNSKVLEYSFQYPRGWMVKQSPPWIMAEGGGVTASFTVISGTPSLIAMEQALKLRSEPTKMDGPWQHAQISASRVLGLLWVRPVARASVASSYYLLETVATRSEATLAKERPLLFAIANSFRGRQQRPAPLPRPAESTLLPSATSNKVDALIIAFAAGLALISLGVVIVRRLRWPTQLTAGLVLLFVLSLFSLAFLFEDVCQYLFGSSVHLPTLSIAQIIFGVGFFGLAATGWARVVARHESIRGKQLIIGVIGLEGAVAFLKVMDYLFTHALSATRVSIWASLILLIAAAWELIMSGESLTNRDTPHFPRDTRVLGFFGYYILLIATVLFYSSQKLVANGHVVGASFEPEAVTQSALFQVAFPVLLVVLVLRLMSTRAPRLEREARFSSVGTGEGLS